MPSKKKFIIVDTCIINNFFYKKDDLYYQKFRLSIMKGELVIIYGGKKFKDELAHFLYPHDEIKQRLIKQLKDNCQIIEINKDLIDNREKKIDEMDPKPPKKFNDRHLVSLACISHCRLLITTDHKSAKYISDKKYYNEEYKDKRKTPIPIYNIRKHKKQFINNNDINIKNLQNKI